MTSQRGAFVARFFVGATIRYEFIKSTSHDQAGKKVKKQFPGSTDIDVMRGTAKDAVGLRTGKRQWPL